MRKLNKFLGVWWYIGDEGFFMSRCPKRLIDKVLGIFEI